MMFTRTPGRPRLFGLALLLVLVVMTHGTAACNFADEGSSGEVPECTGDAQCPDGVCLDQECVDCIEDYHCSGDEICLNTQCISGCEDLDCGHGECLEEADGTVSCECDDGYVLDDDVCVECAADTDCGEHQQCQDSICISACDQVDCGDGGQCVEDDDGDAFCECSDGYAPEIETHQQCIECDCTVDNGVGACDTDGNCHIDRCDQGFSTMDDDPETGCECSDEDYPDPENFADTNCDGVDGDASTAIFVSPDGSDLNAGTADEPVETIDRAIQLAENSDDHHHVYIATGTYQEDELVLSDSISLFGGYVDTGDDAWQRGEADDDTVISGATIEISGNDGVVELQLLTLDATERDSQQPAVEIAGNYNDVRLNHVDILTEDADAVFVNDLGSLVELTSATITVTGDGDGFIADSFEGETELVDVQIDTDEGHGIYGIDNAGMMTLSDLNLETRDDAIHIVDHQASLQLSGATILTADHAHGWYSRDNAGPTTIEDVDVTTGERGDGLHAIGEGDELELTDVDIITGDGGYGIVVEGLDQDSDWTGVTVDAGDGVAEQLDGDSVGGSSVGVWLYDNDGHITIDGIDITTGDGHPGFAGDDGADGAEGADGNSGSGYQGGATPPQSCSHGSDPDTAGVGGQGNYSSGGSAGIATDGSSGSDGTTGGAAGSDPDTDGEDGTSGNDDGGDGDDAEMVDGNPAISAFGDEADRHGVIGAFGDRGDSGEPGDSGAGGGGGYAAYENGGGGGSGGTGGCGGQGGDGGSPGGSSIGLLVESSSVTIDTGAIVTGDGGDGGDGGVGGAGGSGGDGGSGATGRTDWICSTSGCSRVTYGNGGDGGEGSDGGTGGNGSGGQGGISAGVAHDIDSTIDADPSTDLTYSIGEVGAGGTDGSTPAGPDGERDHIMLID